MLVKDKVTGDMYDPEVEFAALLANPDVIQLLNRIQLQKELTEIKEKG